MNKKLVESILKTNVLALLVLVILALQVSAVSLLSYNVNVSSTNSSFISEPNPLTTSSALLIINTDSNSVCRYSEQQGVPYVSMPGNFDIEYGTIHKKTLTGLIDGQFQEYIRCADNYGNVSGELGINFKVNLPVSAQITLDNGENIKDGKTQVNLKTSKIVTDAPQLSYTVDGTNYKQIPLAGSGTDWQGYIIINQPNENDIASFKFQARDLEGNIGTDITSGELFTIDTTPPNTLLDIKAESRNKGTNLTWHADEQNLEFNIYRSTSPGVDYSDFYKQTGNNMYIDNNVLAGYTYYYKVSSVDEAGNEGPMSTEVYAIPSFDNYSPQTTILDPRYVGLVENEIQTASSVRDSISSVANQFDALDGDKKLIFGYLKLSNSINSAKNSISSLVNEIAGYKSQSLAKDVLDKKLSSVEVRLNVIKSNVPESINIVKQSTLSNQITENDASSTFLGMRPDLDYNQLSELSKKSVDAINNKVISVKGQAYNVDVSYLDGSKKQFTIVKKDITLSTTDYLNKSIIESIPKDFAQTASDINVNNQDYTVLKEDPILSFAPDTKQIVYFVQGNVDLNADTKVQTILFDESALAQKSFSLTGFVSLSQITGDGNNSNMLILGAIVIIVLIMYLFVIKRRNKETFELVEIKDKIRKIKEDLEEGDHSKAMRRYSFISSSYKELTKKEQSKIYPELASLHKLLSNKQLNLIGIIFLAIFLIVSSSGIAIGSYYQLESGKNNVTLDKDITVKELVHKNPSIESITYTDELLNESYGFVNVFGGVGKNFIMRSGNNYEVNVKKNITLTD